MGEVPVRAEGALAKVAPTVAIFPQPLRGKCTPSAASGASSPYGKATHYDLCVASLLRYGCHRLTTICASLRSFKLCSLVQLVFAATPKEGAKYFLLPPLGWQTN